VESVFVLSLIDRQPHPFREQARGVRMFLERVPKKCDGSGVMVLFTESCGFTLQCAFIRRIDLKNAFEIRLSLSESAALEQVPRRLLLVFMRAIRSHGSNLAVQRAAPFGMTPLIGVHQFASALFSAPSIT
jgi:hypothetical protein